MKREKIIIICILFMLLYISGCSIFNNSNVINFEDNQEINYYEIPNEDFVQNNFVWFYKPPNYESQINYLTDHYEFFILTKNDEWMRDMVFVDSAVSVIPQYIVLNMIYVNQDCKSTPWQNQVAYKPLDFCWIQENHADWFLLDAQGRRIIDGNFIVMDPSSDGWRHFFLERMIESQKENKWEGVFLDNLDGTLNRFSSTGISLLNYLDDHSYMQANLDFLEFLYESFFYEESYPLYANITFLSERTDWFQFLAFLDGAMMEDWAVDWNNGYLTVENWEHKLSLCKESINNQKSVFLVSQGNPADVSHAKFSYASYLLIANEHVFFRYSNADSYTELWHFDFFDIDLGYPLNDYYSIDDIYYRDFSKGKVVVDPNKHVSDIILAE